jgi:hypothetical protein
MNSSMQLRPFGGEQLACFLHAWLCAGAAGRRRRRIVEGTGRIAAMSDQHTVGNRSVARAGRNGGAYPRQVPLEANPAAERRATNNAVAYWDLVRGEAAVPSLSDIEVMDSATIWNHRFLIRRDRDITDSVFIVCGASARKAIDLPALGRCLADTLPASIDEEVYRACEMAGRDLRPEHLEGEFTRIDGQDIQFRAVFMPLRALSNDLGYIFGAFSARPLIR